MDSFAQAIGCFAIDQRLWDNFFAAMREDLTRSRFATYAAFLRYAEGATVSPTTVYLWLIAAERDDRQTFQLPPDFDVFGCGRNLGLFAYIAHVLRDLAADLATGTCGLVYLAADDMAAHGVTEEMLRRDLAAERASAPVRALVQDLSERATRELVEGRARVYALRSRLTGDRVFILELIIRIYRETIDKLAACNYDPMTGRHRLSDAEKSRIAVEVAAAMAGHA
jgi:phytoene synthase